MSRELPRIVVLGAGFGGLEAVFYLRQRLGKSVDLTVVADREDFVFKPNTIYVPFGKPAQNYLIPLAEPFARQEIEFVHARVEGVDAPNKKVRTSQGEVAYDYLVISTGAGTRPGEVPGLSEHGDNIWTLDDMVNLRATVEKLELAARSGDERRVLFVVPPNNKCSGPLYEIVLMLDTELRRRGLRGSVELAWSTYEGAYIQAFGPRIHEVVETEFTERGITGRLEAPVESVEAGVVHYKDGSKQEYDVLIAFPAYEAAVHYEGLPSDERGFLDTQLETRQVQGHPDIYAIGDAGDFPVKQAFLALLQADTAAEHLAQRVLGEEPSAQFDPVSLCIMEQFDKATFAQVPLRVTGDPARPVEVREEDADMYRVGSGTLWRAGKKMLGTVLPARFRAGKPFHAGTTWELMDAGLRVMSAAFAD